MKRKKSYPKKSKMRKGATKRGRYGANIQPYGYSGRFANNNLGVYTGLLASQHVYNPSRAPEQNFIDNKGAVNITFDDTATTSAFNVIESSLVKTAQGTGASSRIGNQIRIRAIHLRACLEHTPWGPQGEPENDVVPPVTQRFFAEQLVRVVLVVDKSHNGVTFDVPTIARLYEDQDNFNSPRNLASRNRFTVLMDKVIKVTGQVSYRQPVNGGEPAGDDHQYQISPGYEFFEWHNRKLDIPITYSASTATDAAIDTNNIMLLAAVCRKAPVDDAGDMTKIRYYCRLRFSE